MRVHRRLVSGDLHRDDLCGGQRPGEETPGRAAISPRGDVHVDDLPELVDRPVDIAPPTGHLDVSLIDPPAVPDAMPAWACRLRQQRREALHPAENADVVDLHSTLGQQLFHIAIRQAVTEIPAHYEHDHLPREPEASERRTRREDRTNTAAAAHALEHAERRLPSMQQSR